MPVSWSGVCPSYWPAAAALLHRFMSESLPISTAGGGGALVATRQCLLSVGDKFGLRNTIIAVFFFFKGYLRTMSGGFHSG
ncbi:hypothetical protein L1987_63140 [Smallanthus sonchifolius]|uniref:Uncharacterized protein n=1 Tax=Smallanthus sonchifolius TaxID=185202 RepID=A0ACB9CCF5_9ASTR|nr:hypothetical protein L1987_63140 [Smallanthus sonchifolius]